MYKLLDVDECDRLPCSEVAECTNTFGSFNCSCLHGYEGDGFHCEGIADLMRG